MAAYNFIDNNDMEFVKSYLWTNDASKYNGGAVKYDLDYIVTGCLLLR
jgi:hypothetical protein